MAMDFLDRTDWRYRDDADRRSAADRSHDERRASGDVRPEAVPAVEFGGCWYHEAAVEDARRTQKR